MVSGGSSNVQSIIVGNVIIATMIIIILLCDIPPSGNTATRLQES